MKVGDLVKCKVTGDIGVVGGEVLGKTIFIYWANGNAGSSWVADMEVVR